MTHKKSKELKPLEGDSTEKKNGKGWKKGNAVFKRGLARV